ncbi:hypothetical protein BpHYR1_012384 [Brachionus plicatilis]|uniref:Uncharacterized protein n=1 Tax=Brachionus plicatilis TaxID=10195 RepID=A0A3M7RU30_BRAPC|nr:hypothetical protein BpHYR1_012384 [Brachionus plicatilis]
MSCNAYWSKNPNYDCAIFNKYGTIKLSKKTSEKDLGIYVQSYRNPSFDYAALQARTMGEMYFGALPKSRK